MYIIFEIIFPSFFLILMGYILAKISYVKKSWGDGLMSFVHSVAVPGFLFNNVAQLEIADVFNLNISLSFFSGILINFCLLTIFIYKLMRVKDSLAVVLGFGGTFGNTVLIGISLAIAFWGVEGSLPIYSVIGLHSPILFAFLAVLMSCSSKQTDLKLQVITIVKDLMKNPIVVSIALGAIYNFIGFGLSPVISSVLDKFSVVVSTCGLFAIGVALIDFHFRDSFLLTLIISLY